MCLGSWEAFRCLVAFTWQTSTHPVDTFAVERCWDDQAPSTELEMGQKLLFSQAQSPKINSCLSAEARYARNDELGVPFAVTFDFETMEVRAGWRVRLKVWLVGYRARLANCLGITLSLENIIYVCLNSRLLIYLKVQWSLQNAATDLLRLIYSPSSNLNSHRYNTSMPWLWDTKRLNLKNREDSELEQTSSWTLGIHCVPACHVRFKRWTWETHWENNWHGRH